MSIFRRLGQLIRAFFNNLISKAEDPEKLLPTIINDMGEEYQEAQDVTAAIMAEERKIYTTLTRKQEASAEAERRAMKCVEAGRDDLALGFLERKNGLDAEIAILEKTHADYKARVEEVKADLRRYKNKIEQAERDADMLTARKQAAEMKQRLAELQSGITSGSGSAFAQFEAMREKVETAEARAEAVVEMNDEFNDRTLEDQFAELETESVATDALAALKVRMGQSVEVDSESEATVAAEVEMAAWEEELRR